MSESDIIPVEIAPPNGVDPKIYDDMVHHLRLKLQRPFTAPKIVMLVASGVKFLTDVSSMSGLQKKDLVLHALRETVKRSSFIPESEKQTIIVLIDTFGDGLIEHFVEFAYDSYTFIKNKAKGLGLRCCRKQTETASVRAIVSLGTRGLNEYEILKDYLKLNLQRPVTAPKIISAIAAGVKYIEHYQGLSGAEKKDVVICAIRDVILESDLSEEDKAGLVQVVDTFADETIDYLVEFGKNIIKQCKCKCKKK